MSVNGALSRDEPITASQRSEVDELSRELPRVAPIEGLPEADHLDDRVAVVNAVCPFTVGVGQDCIEWVPDGKPPSADERFSWLWLLRPELGRRIEGATKNATLQRLIGDYERAYRGSSIGG